MTKVTSNISVDFPKFNWGINAGAERELPADPDAQEVILATPGITEVKGSAKPSAPSDDEPKKDNEQPSTNKK